jgi:hypothetical protein
MTISGTNQWGPYTAAADGDTQPVYPPTSAPQPTGDLVVVDSPDGVAAQPIWTQTNSTQMPTVYSSPPTFNWDESESSTEYYLAAGMEIQTAQQGTAALANSTVQATVSGIGQTTSTTQPLAINNWYSGSVGKTGGKFVS